MTNLYYRGDNLEFLKAAVKKGLKYDVIYIDPPYNTGNTNLPYKDNYGSEWLDFIRPRIEASKRLLKDNGLIMISLDYNSIFDLKPLMDEVYGRSNFVSDLVVETANPNGVKVAHKKKTLVKVKEYVLIYAKNKNKTTLKPQYEGTYEYDSEYNIILYKGNRYTYHSFLKEYGCDTSCLLSMIEEGVVLAFRSMRDFEYQTKRHLNKINDYIIVFSYKNTHGEYDIRKTKLDNGKTLYLRHNKTSNKIDMLKNKKDKIKDGKVLKLKGDLWKGYNKFYGNVDKEGGVSFKNGKKTIHLIKDLIDLHPNKNARVLDFFAGSGTTAHAVLDLNKDDGGRRGFTIVDNNEAGNVAGKRLENIKQQFDFKYTIIEGADLNE